MIVLRPDQQTLKDGIYGNWHSGAQNVVGVAATGWGKSILTSDIILDGHNQGMSEVVMAHRNELVGQMSMHIARRGIPHRIIGAKQTIANIVQEHRAEFGRSFINPDARCAVGSVDTIVARQADLKQWAAQVDRWTLDECHHAALNGPNDPNKWVKAINMFTNARGLGVTACTVRADGRGIGRHADGVFDSMVLSPEMRWVIDQGFLADYELVCPTSDLVVDDADFAASGDLSHKKGRAASQKSHIVGDVVEEYMGRSHGRRAIVFATDVETANDMAMRFNANGIPAASVSAKTNDVVRRDMIRRFKVGKLWVLVNVDLFDEGFDCLDMQTEILTPNGWVGAIDAMGETHCYAWDVTTGCARIVPILKHGMRDLRDDEKMLTIESQHTDIRVTEGHRMFFKDVNYYMFRATGNMSPDVKVCNGAELFANTKRFALPLCGGANEFPGVPISDDEIRVIGWYMTDGYLNRDRSLEIYQVKKHQIVNIREMLDRLGWQYREKVKIVDSGYKPGISITTFSIPRREIAHILQYMDKRNPPAVLHGMTRDQFRILWGTMMDGNGSNATETKAGYLCTMHKGQADMWTHMAAVRGFATMFGTYKTSNGVVMFNLRIRDKQWMQFYKRDPRGARFDLSVPDNRETVWCIQNELGTIITRRNGKIVVLGNCPGASVVIQARPTGSLNKYKQMVGRAMRSDPNDPSKIALIIDMVSNWKRHGLPDKPVQQTLDRREKRAKKAPDPDDIPLRACGECSRPYERVLTACPYCGAEPPLPAPGTRSLEQVDGDLMLLDREKLAQMRAALEMEAPGDLEGRVGAVAGPVAGRAARNRQYAKIESQARLRATLEQWAGVRAAAGDTDQMIHKRLYLATGMSMLDMLAGDRTGAEFDTTEAMVRSWYEG